MINQEINYKNNPRKIENIVVHCTATPQTATITAIENYWKNNLKWKNPGYHYIVKPDGTVVSLLPETLTSNGVQGFNHNSVHISYIGGVNAQGQPADNRTPHQKNALMIALKMFREKYPNARIKGHRDFPGVKKACPAFNAITEYAHI